VIIFILLITPSVSAFQWKIIKIKTFKDCLNDLNIDDGKEIKSSLKIKYPALYLLFIGSMISRNIRIILLVENAYELKNWPYIEIKHPILYYRLIMLVITTQIWSGFWEYWSYKYEWNWIIPHIIENYL
jgi:hypothetical protein